MSLLHIVNKSPFTHMTIQSCLDHCSSQDSVIFIEDGVLNALTSSPYAERINAMHNAGTNFYVLSEDVTARGIAELSEIIEKIDYVGFVRLSISHSPIQSWY